MAGRAPDRGPATPSTKALALTKQSLLEAALTKSSRQAYDIHLQRFKKFIKLYYPGNTWPRSPVDSQILSAFISYLVVKNMHIVQCYQMSQQ